MSANSDLSPIQLPSVSEAVYDTLKQQIVAGRLVPGTQLNLSQLEEQLGVSRTPLRSALAQLQAEGLVDIHSRRGTYITEYSERDIEECYDLRIALETHALQHVFNDHHRKRLAELIALLEAMDLLFRSEDTWLDELPDFMSMDRAFHVEIVSLSGNDRILKAYEFANVQGYIAVMGARFHYEDVLKTKDEHLDVLAALRARKLPDVLRTARDHLNGAKTRAMLRLAGAEDDLR